MDYNRCARQIVQQGIQAHEAAARREWTKRKRRRVVSVAAAAGRDFELSIDMKTYLPRVGCRLPCNIVADAARAKSLLHADKPASLRERSEAKRAGHAAQ